MILKKIPTYEEIGFVETTTINHAKIAKYIFYFSLLIGIAHIIIGSFNNWIILGMVLTYLGYLVYDGLDFPKYMLNNPTGEVYAEIEVRDENLEKMKKIIKPVLITEKHDGDTRIHWYEDDYPAEQVGYNLYYKILRKDEEPEYFL